MDIWDAINNTLSIIAWPLVAITAVVLFRGQIGRLIGRVNQLEAFGAKVRAEQHVEWATSEYTHRVRGVVTGTVVENVTVTPPQLDHADAEDVTAEQDDEPQAEIEGAGESSAPAAELVGTGYASDGEKTGFDKSQVEEFIRAAGLAGYEIGVSGRFEGPVEPVVRWTEDDVPEIDHWEGRRGDGSSAPPLPWHFDREERAQRLEEEIKELTFKTSRPAWFISSIGAGRSGEEIALDRLKERLRWLDPNSPWVE